MTLIKRVFHKLKYYVLAKTNLFEYTQKVLQYKKVEGNYKYSVISAVYNVDKYLEDYFQSITNQTLMFEKHIHLIMVDDGSTDKSASIIKKWQTKYPDNIVYVKKENGGQASARNLGLEYVLGEWVGFIDPDDFLDYRYFEVVDNYLSNSNSDKIGLVSCNTIFYYEKGNRLADTHALKFRFKNNHRLVNPSSMEGCIQLSASSVLFKISLLKQSSIKFNEDIKPSFEDAHFVNKYILDNRQIDIVFLKKAKYLYRKRVDGTSTLDGSWKTVDKYINVLEKGYLDLLKYAYKKDGEVPLYIQRTILYELTWHFGLFVNNSHKLNHLTKEQKEKYLSLISEVFEFIEVETIENFNLAGYKYYQKYGILQRYKNTKPHYLKIYIEKYYKNNNELKLRYYHFEDKEEYINLKSDDLTIITQKNKKYNFLDKLFIYETNIWIKLKDNQKSLNLSLNKGDTYIDLNGKLYKNSISIDEIEKAFKTPMVGLFFNKINTSLLTLNTPNKRGLKDSWLLIDRDNQADDNAEHFYRYLKDNYPKENIYFLLRKSSYDWHRLKEEGFNLIPFASFTHIVALLQASHLISSHADSYVTDFIPRRFFKSFLRYKFTFLQHGVILNDLSNWLNIKDIDCFITTIPQEYKSIAGDNSHYKFTSKEVILTGLARHDKLLSRKELTQKVILIMPTWRKSFVGDTKRNSAKRTKIDAFYKSDYAEHWKSILHSSKLKDLAQKNGYKVVFFPHANMQIYIDWFDTPSWIEVLTHKTSPNIQKLFKQATIMITDYSSVFFEFAFLQKALIYYQFDYDFMYGGDQQSQLGYFDFKKDGFGAVVESEKELLSEIEYLLLRNGEPDSIYKKRMINTFPNRDAKNCQRIYEAIIKLDYNERRGNNAI